MRASARLAWSRGPLLSLAAAGMSPGAAGTAGAGGVPLSYKLASSYKGACFAELTRPGGESFRAPRSGVIDAADAPGVYRLKLTFTKKARLGVEAAGAPPVLFLAADQGTYRLRKRWGRPAF